MIERYDFGQLKLNSQEYLHGFEFCILADIAHLLRPPTWKDCGACGGSGGIQICDDEAAPCCFCNTSGKIPVFYTPAQYQQWFVDNKLPVQEWTGPVWYRTVTDISGPMDWIIMGSVKAAACFYEGEKHSFESRIIHDKGYPDNLSCDRVIANEAGKPPYDYEVSK